ncbi:aldo/keto reductase [Reichenbachiella agarivorans]|uniref:Aldo/keto reductase n=1 Tax=Reichenbachiella agarivorans TaxID=2979464 RepID=A0ABY6CPQ5_9BACT|nr:aldo/keto reductase [Reichenbachiella agarivorans]UXP32477.1 aldo/keto reductase [Reichenbachiella agarivorans]
MIYYSLKNGDQMPALGLGTWQSRHEEAYAAVRKAIQIGYRHFDCASIYQNEKEIGRALNDAIAAGEVKRKDLWITSKLWNTHHRAEDVIVALKHTLSDLHLEFLDLYLVHWPVAQRKQVLIPSTADDLVSLDELSLEDTWSGMEECVMAGLTKHIGVSNFNSKKIKRINKSSKIKIEVNQVESHPYLQQGDLLKFCQKNAIILTAYAPLGAVERASKMPNHELPYLYQHPVIAEIAKARELTAAQVLIAWAINRGSSVIPKSTNPSRLQENFDAASIPFTVQEMKSIEVLNANYRYERGEYFTLEGSDYSAKSLWED